MKTKNEDPKWQLLLFSLLLKDFKVIFFASDSKKMNILSIFKNACLPSIFSMEEV
jgi:hypothetical protein